MSRTPSALHEVSLYHKQEIKDLLEKIAQERLRLPTLEIRRKDTLDFHNVAVWEIREALEAAYRAGYFRAVDERFPK